MNEARIYLDHAASAPLDPAAREVLVALAGLPGNPSSPHAEGRRAKDELETARSRVADTLGCRPREVVFTGSGTEAAQIGLWGLAEARRSVSRRVVISAAEHAAVRETAAALSQRGFEVTSVALTPSGCVEASAFLEAVGSDAALAALMLANHETGALMPVTEVARTLRERGIPLLCDAALGPGRLPVDRSALPVDVLVLSGHKFGGPVGCGILVVRRGVSVEPWQRGGLQEERLRPGTENVPAWCASSVALERACRETGARAETYRERVATLLSGLAPLADWRPVGPAERLPGLVTLELAGVEGEAAMINLDLEGIAVATGSTCALGSTDPSPTLLAMGFTKQRAASTIRISVGEGVAPEDVIRATSKIRDVANRLRALARS